MTLSRACAEFSGGVISREWTFWILDMSVSFLSKHCGTAASPERLPRHWRAFLCGPSTSLSIGYEPPTLETLPWEYVKIKRSCRRVRCWSHAARETPCSRRTRAACTKSWSDFPRVTVRGFETVPLPKLKLKRWVFWVLISQWFEGERIVFVVLIRLFICQQIFVECCYGRYLIRYWSNI